MTPEELKVIRDRLDLSTRIVGPTTMGKKQTVVWGLRQDIKTLFEYIEDLELTCTALERVVTDNGTRIPPKGRGERIRARLR